MGPVKGTGRGMETEVHTVRGGEETHPLRMRSPDHQSQVGRRGKDWDQHYIDRCGNRVGMGPKRRGGKDF